MDIQQIRNATLRITYAGRTFLIDPWLADKGATGSFAGFPDYRCLHPAQSRLAMPLCALPLPVERVLKGIDACIVTHLHPDHIDMDAGGTVGAPLDRTVPMFAQNEDDAAVLRRSGFIRVTVLTTETVFEGIRLIRTPGCHGTLIPCGPASGVLFEHPEEARLYVAGDTIWYAGVAEILHTFQPGVIILNACAAELESYGRLIMDDGDVEAVCRACPDARIIISHMDTVAHASLTRTSLRERLIRRGLAQRIVMPEDGEVCSVPSLCKSERSLSGF